MSPTQRPTAPAETCCPHWPLCGGDLGRCCNGGAPTVRLAPPDPVAAVWRLRAERASLMGRVDALDEALRTLLAGMTPEQRAALDGAD